MTILHLSDTHLGYQAYDAVNDAGVNTREQDVYDAFTHVVDRILDIRPDVVLHTGDFFHRPSPSNRALTLGLEQLRRVSEQGIPFVVIAGNHEAPKSVFTSPILRALRTLPNIYPVFEEKYACFEWDGVAIHGMPHFNDLQKQSEALERLTAKPDAFNIVMLHTSLGQEYRMDEYGEQIFPPDFYQKLQAFDYVALGHWHEYQPVGMHPNAWYSGSTERFSESEVGYEKGFILLNTGDGSHSFEAIPTRPWYKFHLKKCREQTVKELEEQLHLAAKNMETDGAIVSVLLDQITVEQSLEMSNLRIQTLFPGCLQLLIRRRTWNDNTVFGQIDSGAFDSLDKLFSAYISEKYKDNQELSAQLRKRADQYFQRFS